MASFMNSIKSAVTGTTTAKADEKAQPDQPSSGQAVTEAAQTVVSNQAANIEKAKVAVAGAGADFIDSTKQYVKLDEKNGPGQYVKKADDYLHQYGKPGATSSPPAEGGKE